METETKQCCDCNIEKPTIDFTTSRNIITDTGEKVRKVARRCRPCEKIFKAATYLKVSFMGEKVRDKLKSLRRRARVSKLDFDLTLRDLERFYSVKSCACCNLSLDNDNADCDRVEPLSGYTSLNINALCKRCNYMKKDLIIGSIDQMIKYIENPTVIYATNNNIRTDTSLLGLLQGYKGRARAKGFDCDFDLPSMRDLYSVAACCCCGSDFSKYRINGDRKDNNVGYIKGNVFPLCGLCNARKGENDVRSLCAIKEYILKHQNKQTEFHNIVLPEIKYGGFENPPMLNGSGAAPAFFKYKNLEKVNLHTGLVEASYPVSAEATIAEKCSVSGLEAILKGKVKTLYGFGWICDPFEGEPEPDGILIPERNVKYKNVRKIDPTTGETLATYRDLLVAAKEEGVRSLGLRLCLSGQRKTYLGFRWECDPIEAPAKPLPSYDRKPPVKFRNIDRINIATGLVEKTYPFVRDAIEDVGGQQSTFSLVLNGKRDTYQGSYWVANG